MLGDDTPELSQYLPSTVDINDYSLVLDDYANRNLANDTQPTTQKVNTALVPVTKTGGVETITVTQSKYPWWLVLAGFAVGGYIIYSVFKSEKVAARRHYT